jgi:hypothetical protein
MITLITATTAGVADVDLDEKYGVPIIIHIAYN